jgi:hypothetical protein
MERVRGLGAKASALRSTRRAAMAAPGHLIPEVSR